MIALARERGWLNADQLTKAQHEQKQLADHGVDHGLWFVIQDLGFISDEQARELRKNMSSSRLRALQIDGYTIQGRIGSGGMGDVFRGSDQHGREVAIKLLSSKLARNEEHVQRFSREAKATLRLHHPHITRSLSAGDMEGTRYLMMELVSGKSLKQWISDHGKLPPRHGLVLLRQVGDALRFAWKEGVLHRDVKPANIILGPARPGVDEPFCAKLCDFGLARVWQGDGESSHGELTASGLALGTPHYMSPEQASGDKNLDQRTDIYGLGASLYHALLGHTMYSGKSSAVIMYKQVTEALDLGELSGAGVDQRMTDLIGRMLAKRRDDRIATWDAVITETDRLLGRKLSTPATGVEGEAKQEAKPPTKTSSGLVAMRASGLVPTRTALPPPLPEVRPQTETRPFPETQPVARAPSHPPAPATQPLAKTTATAIERPTSATARMVRAVSVSRTLLLTVVVAVLATFLLAAIALLVVIPRGAQPAGPADWRSRLAATVGHGGELRLGPGRYVGDLTLDSGHVGLLLVAAPGAVLDGVLRAAPGAAGCTVRGLVVGNPGNAGPGIDVGRGASLTFDGGACNGSVLVEGGLLTVRGGAITGRVAVEQQGWLALSGTRVEGALDITASRLQIDGSIITADRAPALRIVGGHAQLAGVRLHARSSSALDLSDGVEAKLADVLGDGAETGLRASGARLVRAERVTWRGTIAVQWKGQVDPAWIWQAWMVTGPLDGLATVPAGAGADPAALPSTLPGGPSTLPGGPSADPAPRRVDAP